MEWPASCQPSTWAGQNDPTEGAVNPEAHDAEGSGETLWPIPVCWASSVYKAPG